MWVLPLKHESLVHTYIECPCHIEITLVSQDRPNHPQLEFLSLLHTVYTRQLLKKWLQGLDCFPFRHQKYNWYLTQPGSLMWCRKTLIDSSMCNWGSRVCLCYTRPAIWLATWQLWHSTQKPTERHLILLHTWCWKWSKLGLAGVCSLWKYSITLKL